MFFTDSKIEAIDRVLKFVETGGTTKGDSRPLGLRVAWQQFIDSPIIGDSYLVAVNGSYPHNIYLESFMATGLIGATMFLMLILIIFWKVLALFKYFNSVNFILLLLMLVFLLSGMTSGSLFANPGFWNLLAFVLAISTKENLIKKSYSSIYSS